MPIDEDLRRLERIAAAMDDLFDFPLPDAPGMTFVGGRFSVVDALGRAIPFSVGAADEDAARARRRCLAEVAETVAQFRSRHDADGVVARRLSDGKPATVPATLCFRDAGDGTHHATSLGCAAGRTMQEATASALLELVERDAIALWWRGGAPAAAIRQDDLRELCGLVDRARSGQAGRRTWFLDVTSDIGIPVIAAISADATGGSIAAGFAARPTVEHAAMAAFRELAQMEMGNRLVAMKFERGGIDALADVERAHLSRMREVSATDPRFTGTRNSGGYHALDGDPLEEIRRRIVAVGADVFVVELSTSGDAIPVVKAIAPLLQAEPSDAITQRLARSREIHGFVPGHVSSVGLI